MRKIKLFNLIQYIKSVEFYHDTFDLEEEGIKGILKEYGIYDEFTEDELQEFKQELYDMAEQNEFREAMVMASKMDLVPELA